MPDATDKDNPEITDASQFHSLKRDYPELAEALKRGPGRPVSDNPKQPVYLRLDQDVIAHFKADGRGWQTRINEALRVSAGLDPSRNV